MSAPPSPACRQNRPSQEERTFDALYMQHFGFVWRCLRGLGVSPHAIDDAAQEVFMVVHRRLPEFRSESSVTTWLYGIVRNVAANHRRGERRRPTFVALQREVSSSPDPLDHAQDRQAAAFVNEFLAKASETKRDVFVLVLLEGMTVPEVAAVLGIPLATAYTRLRDVRLEFQRALARRGKS